MAGSKTKKWLKDIMAIEEHFDILKQGKNAWNSWMQSNWRELPKIELRADKPLRNAKAIYIPFTRADLSGLDLTEFKSFKGYNFGKVNFSHCNLKGIDFSGSNLRRSNFSNCNMRLAKFDNCNLDLAYLVHANLNKSSFKSCSLINSNLSNCELFQANFSNANLSGSSLMWAQLIETVFVNATLSNCRVYGASIWNSNFENATQFNILINKRNEYDISVDNIEIAQFLYLITSNKKIKDVIETLTSKVVLILGRFTSGRKSVLDKIKNELIRLNYVPVIFDFQKPVNKDFIEPVLLLAHLAKFVLADFSDSNIILEEVPLIAQNTSVVIVPIIEESQIEPTTLRNLRINHISIAKTYRYKNIEQLIETQLKEIIITARQIQDQLSQRRM